jgi:membrane fusion protein (multidrug efflux system)
VTKGLVSSLLASLAFSSSSLIFAACETTTAAAPPPLPPEVSIADVVERNVPLRSEWIATLDGFVNAQVRPQVSGYLVKRNYREGSPVHRGDVLFEIDPRPFEAALAQARAQLAQAWKLAAALDATRHL